MGVDRDGEWHYDRKFQIFIFLIGYINVNKGIFCLIISYLRIKSYNILKYNNCSTVWSFPLTNNVHCAIYSFEDTKGVTCQKPKSKKDRHNNGQKKNDKIRSTKHYTEN